MRPEDVLKQFSNSQVVSRLIYVVARLGIADLLKDGPRSYKQLAESTKVHPHSLYRVLRTLASVGVFSEIEAGLFEQTPAGSLLQSDIVGSQRALAMLFWEPWWRQGWDELLDCVKTGKVAFDRVHGMSLFDFLSGNAEASDLFNRAMTSFTEKESDSILPAYNFSGFTRIVDVGGGHGGFIRAVLGAYPQIEGVVLDLPHTIEEAKRIVREKSVENRCFFAAGDFFEWVPEGGDLYTLKSIIHDWDDDRAVEILRNCRRAIRQNGRLLMVERVLPTGNEPSAGKIMDIVMMVNLGGVERSATEYRALLEKADFRMVQIIPTASAVSIIECVPV